MTGESITTAVTIAVQERLRRVRGQQRSEAERASRLVELGREIAGDCFACALASESGEPLLFKGNDFIHTDLHAVISAD